MKTVLTIILTCLCFFAVKAEDERLSIDAKISGKPVRLIFDTGLSVPLVLFSTTAKKLGLKVTLPPPDNKPEPGQTPMGLTGPCDFDLGVTNLEAYFSVIEMPAYLKWDEDGILGWPAISNNVFSMDFVAHKLNLLTNVPEESRIWLKFQVRTDSGTLDLESIDHKIIALDSGADDGVRLNPQSWRKWKATLTNQPITITAYYTPNPGLVVSEETWANKISLESLTLTGVPVMEANSSDVALGSLP